MLKFFTFFCCLFFTSTVFAENYRHTKLGQGRRSAFYVGANFIYLFSTKAKDITLLNLVYDDSSNDLERLLSRYQNDYETKEVDFNYRPFGLNFVFGLKGSGIMRYQFDFGVLQAKRDLTDKFSIASFTDSSGSTYDSMFLTTRTLYFLPKVYFEMDRLGARFIPFVGLGAGAGFNVAYFQNSGAFSENRSTFMTNKKYLSGIALTYQLVAGFRVNWTSSVLMNLEYQRTGVFGSNISYSAGAVGLIYMFGTS